MEKRVFLVHGWEGRPDNHWFPWLTWELKSRGFEVYAITMPHPDVPTVSEWVGTIKDIVENPDVNTFFVGHSLGCIAVVRYFETLSPKIKVGGAVFVAGFLSSLGISAIEEFCSFPLDMGKVRSHCDKFVTIFSDNDEYVPMNKSLEFKLALGAKAIIEPGKGHFSKNEGSVSLPAVFQSIIKMSAQS